MSRSSGSLRLALGGRICVERMRTPDAADRLLARSPDSRRPRLMRHRWESLLFLHWRVPIERLQPTLPRGLLADTFDGDAYIGLVPFFMRDVRFRWTPALPWLSKFQELNVRTYVHDAAGVPGVWFYSLDCNQPLAVAAARMLTGLNYVHAEMSASVAGGFVDYNCRRSGTPDVARYRYRGIGVERESEAESLEFFLLERYYLYARRGRSLVRGQVSHAPYRYRDAELPAYSCLPAQLHGFAEVAGDPVHSCFVDGFDVNIYATEKIGRL